MQRVTAAQFSVKYDGPAVTPDHAIDAAMVGGSLIALSELVQDAQSVINPDGPRYRVRVRTTGQGSFEVLLEVAEFWENVRRLFAGQDIQAITNLLAIFGSGGVIGVILWLRGRKPDEIQETESGTTFRLDQQELTVERSVGKLYRSRKVHKSLSAFVQPVTRDAIAELTIQIPGHEPRVITPQDRPALAVPLGDDLIFESTTTLTLTIVVIQWDSIRWQFREPTTGRFWATIEDTDFLRRVDERREGFHHDDALECVVRIQQWDVVPEGIRTDHSILTVLRHLPSDRGQQMVIE